MFRRLKRLSDDLYFFWILTHAAKPSVAQFCGFYTGLIDSLLSAPFQLYPGCWNLAKQHPGDDPLTARVVQINCPDKILQSLVSLTFASMKTFSDSCADARRFIALQIKKRME